MLALIFSKSCLNAASCCHVTGRLVIYVTKPLSRRRSVGCMEKGRWSEDKNVQLLSRPVRQQPLGSLFSSLYLFLNNCNHLASHLGLDLPYFQSLSLPSVLYFLPTSLNTSSNFNPSFSLHRRPFPVSTFFPLSFPPPPILCLSRGLAQMLLRT